MKHAFPVWLALCVPSFAWGQSTPIVIDTSPGATPRAVLVVYEGRLFATTTVTGNTPGPTPPQPDIPSPPAPVPQTAVEKAVFSFLGDLKQAYADTYRATSARIAAGISMDQVDTEHRKQLYDLRLAAGQRWIVPMLEQAMPAGTDPTSDQRAAGARITREIAEAFAR